MLRQSNVGMSTEAIRRLILTHLKNDEMPGFIARLEDAYPGEFMVVRDQETIPTWLCHRETLFDNSEYELDLVDKLSLEKTDWTNLDPVSLAHLRAGLSERIFRKVEALVSSTPDLMIASESMRAASGSMAEQLMSTIGERVERAARGQLVVLRDVVGTVQWLCGAQVVAARLGQDLARIVQDIKNATRPEEYEEARLALARGTSTVLRTETGRLTPPPGPEVLYAASMEFAKNTILKDAPDIARLFGEREGAEDQVHVDWGQSRSSYDGE